MAREIVRAKEEEFTEYEKLRREAIKYITKISGLKIELSSKEIKKEFLSPNSNKNNKIFFLKSNEEIIGMLNILFIKNAGNKISYLNEITISDKHKGKGHGKYLVKKFIDFSKKEKANTIKLGTRIENKPAINLYKKLGFKIAGYNFEMKLK